MKRWLLRKTTKLENWAESDGANLTVEELTLATGATVRIALPKTAVVKLFAGLLEPAEVTPPPPPVNQPPMVDAGPDQTIILPNTATLVGVVTDDGLPNAALLAVWSQVSGPGNAQFTEPDRPATTVKFSPVPGVYVLKLSATDTVLSASDTVTITVQAAPPPPSASSLDLTLSRSITV